jgi:hypothetical protein
MRTLPACLLLALLVPGFPTAAAPRATRLQPHPSPAPRPSDAAATQQALERFDGLPMAFEENRGQTDGRVRYLARGRGYTLFLTPEAAVLSLSATAAAEPSKGGSKFALREDADRADAEPVVRRAAVRLSFEGTDARARMVGAEPLEAKSNYMIGNDPAKWHADVPNFARVRYEGMYPGIDAVYYGTSGQMEYDFVVAPGADPGLISMRVEGADRVAVDESGDLLLEITGQTIRQKRPMLFQEGQRGERMLVPGGYTTDGAGGVRFDVGSYDPSRPLVIDPALLFSTFLGGSAGATGSYDSGQAIALNGQFAYVTGFTNASDYPTTGGAYARLATGKFDVFVTKMSADGSTLVFSTYLGGAGSDYGLAIAVDAAGAAYVTGQTNSPDFPTANPLFGTGGGVGFNDAFVTKLSAAGNTLAYSTYLGSGGDDYGNAIAVDAAGAAYVTGRTGGHDFPTMNPLFGDADGFGGGDAFVTKLSAAGNTLAYSTYLGGMGDDYGYGIAVDAVGAAYVAGQTTSPDFPTVNPLFGVADGFGFFDAFVTKLSAAGNTLAYSTYLGGTGDDYGNAIAIDAAGAAYVAGETSSLDFPTVNPLFGDANGFGSNDAFVAKLSAAGNTLAYSTYLGGGGPDFGYGIVVDAAGRAHVTGETESTNFPTVNPLFGDANGFGSSDAFVTKLNAAGSTLAYSTYLGGGGIEFGYGIAVDAAGAAYVAGETSSSNFSTTVGAFDPSFNGGISDAFVTKLNATGNALTYSTYLGGITTNSDDVGFDVAIDSAGSIYTVGYSSSVDYPTTPGAYNTNNRGLEDVFVTKLSAAGNTLVYSTYLGGTNIDFGHAIAVDAAGAAYVTGITSSPNFPTVNPIFGDADGFGSNDAFVTKLSAAGNALVYSTYLGGAGVDLGFGIAVDAAGAAYVTGNANSLNFPTVNPLFGDADGFGGGDAFVTKLSAAGNVLVYSTYLGGGGSDFGSAIAVDATGAVYVTGQTTSTNFPTVTPLFGDADGFGSFDAFVTKLSAAGNALAYSTYLGGTEFDRGNAIAVDAAGAAYVTGRTTSTNFPTVNPLFGDADGNANGSAFGDAFVTKLSAAGTTLTYSTYLGGTGDDIGYGLAVDGSGAIYVAGSTQSSTFPTTADAYDPGFNGASDAFITKLSVTGSTPAHSTFLGGSDSDDVSGIALAPTVGVCIVGTSSSVEFPTTPGAFDPDIAVAPDAFVLLYCIGDHAPPGITAQPLDQTINRGQTATLSVGVTSVTDLELKYQWYRGESGFTADPVAGATSATLVTPPLQSTTKFWCKVTDACGVFTDSASATVTVLRAAVPVTNANDTGAGSLRQAILAANADPGTDTITFNLSAPATINLASPLATITEPVVLDGLSQPGSAVGAPVVVLSGPGAGPGQADCDDDAMATFDGLHFAAGAAGSVVRGLVVQGFPGDGIELEGGGDAGHQSLVQSCFVGTNAAGTAAARNGRHGIYLNNTAYAVIGGDRAPDGTLALGNLVSGNHCSGIEIAGGLAANNTVVGCNVGPDRTGHFPIGNGVGIRIQGAPNTVIGAAGDDASKRNQCGYNSGAGVVTGTASTAPAGEQLNTVILGTTFNDNGGGAIVGGAPYMPALTSASIAATTLSVEGTAMVPANREYRVQYFSSTTCLPTGGQGEVLLAADVLKQAGPSGVLDLAFSSSATTARPGELVAVTVTGTEGTSNFSSCQIVTGRLAVVAEASEQVGFLTLPSLGGAGPVEQGTPASGVGGTPALDRSFAGPRDPDDPDVASDEVAPADPQAAVGPGHVVAVTNTEISVASKANGAVTRRVAIDSMWAGLRRTPEELLLAFNPRAVYDALGGRYVLAATANPSEENSAVLVAVSATSDPSGQWNVYRYDAEGAEVLWADYPTLGFNQKWIGVQVNMSSIAFANVIVRSEVYLIDKAAAYAGAPGTGKATVLGRGTTDGDFGATQMPAVTYDASATTLWLAQTGPGNVGGKGTVRTYQVTGAVGAEALAAGPVFETTDVWFTNQLPYGDLAPQSGTLEKLQINDTRMQSVVYRNGRLYLAHTVLLPAVSPTHATVQWWVVNPAGPAGAPEQRGVVAGASSTQMYAHPSLAVSGTGAMALGYSRFTSAAFPSFAYRFRSAGDAANTLRGEVVVKAGEAKYVKRLGGPDNRWGDYSSVTVDPAEGERFWLLGSYAETPRAGTTGSTDQWGVWWASTAGSGACTVTCAPNVVVQTGAGAIGCGRTVSYTAPTATGPGCGPVSCTPPSGSIFAVGVTTVTCTAGGSFSCAFTVTVQDTTPPQFTTCPGARTVAAGASCRAAVPNLVAEAVATDNCAGVTITQSPAAGTLVGLGVTTVTLTATDASGNTATCQLGVTVADQTAPTIQCPSNITTTAASGACTRVVNFPLTVSDNCTGPITVTTSQPSGTEFPVGVTPVTVTATDGAGNSSQCQFTVTVQDLTAPQLSCPANIQTVAITASGRVVTYATPTVTDACAGASVTCLPASGSTFAVGTTTVTCTATDASSNQAQCSFAVEVAPLGLDTVGVYVPSTGAWFLRNGNSPGGAELVFTFGPANPTWVALRGDWNGDGVDTPGLYDPSTGFFFLKNTQGPGGADLVFSFGPGGAFVPMVGDWDGDGVETIGIYDPASGAFFLRNANAPGGADLLFTFGAGGQGFVPLAGDWDGDGDDTIGLYAPSNGFFFLRNQNAPGGADLVFSFGAGGAGIDPVVGDYDGDGDDTVGIYIQSSGTWFLRQTNTPGGADLAFGYGPAGARPLIGDWNGQ